MFTGQAITRGFIRVWMFGGGSRLSEATYEFLTSKVKILWDIMQYKIVIIIIIIQAPLKT